MYGVLKKKAKTSSKHQELPTPDVTISSGKVHAPGKSEQDVQFFWHRQARAKIEKYCYRFLRPKKGVLKASFTFGTTEKKKM